MAGLGDDHLRLTDDVGLVQRVLDRSAGVIGDFVERTLERVQQVMRPERDDLLCGNRPDLREMVALLLDGAPVTRDRASARLGFDLGQPHTAAVIWLVDGGADQAPLCEVADLLIRACENRRHVSIFPSTGLAWVWFAGRGPAVKDVEPELRSWPDARVALSETRTGVEGFRASRTTSCAQPVSVRRRPCTILPRRTSSPTSVFSRAASTCKRPGTRSAGPNRAADRREAVSGVPSSSGWFTKKADPAPSLLLQKDADVPRAQLDQRVGLQ